MQVSKENAGKAKHSTLTGTPCGAKSARIPAITVRAGKVKKPRITLGEVLNFIDAANRRQSRIILNAMRQTAWYVPNQTDYAFGGFACKERRAAV